MIIRLYQFFMTVILLLFYPVGVIFSIFGRPNLLRRLVPPADIPEDDVLRIWIHAASMGEAVIAFSMACELRKKKPGSLIFVSTTTLTGFERIQLLAGQTGRQVVECSFLAPFDHPLIVRRFLRKLRPNVFVLVETEIWPSLITAVQRRGIPITIINGKLGRRAFRRYRMFRRSMQRIMRGVSLVCVQSRSFARRYHMLGVPPECIEILGNIKFDSLPDPSIFKPSLIRTALGIPRKAKVFVAGSTRPGEEEIIAGAFTEVLRECPEAVLVLAPRHLNRVAEVERVLEAAGLPVLKRSAGMKLGETECRVLMLDTMGELLGAFASADVAFVGGSLRDFGGHNPLEPAALGLPVLFGPYMEQTGAKELLSGGAAMLVHDERELADALRDLFGNSGRRRDMAQAGPKIVARFKGILARTIQCMESRKIL